MQLDALKQQGCQKNYIFVDKASGAWPQRPSLDACLEIIQAGAVLHMWRLDRLGRSMSHLITVVEELRNRQIGFRPVCDGILGGIFVRNIPVSRLMEGQKI